MSDVWLGTAEVPTLTTALRNTQKASEAQQLHSHEPTSVAHGILRHTIRLLHHARDLGKACLHTRVQRPQNV